MSFDKIFYRTAGVSFDFYNIYAFVLYFSRVFHPVAFVFFVIFIAFGKGMFD